jgi:polyisoprenoid-binding protein YceI
VVAALAASQPLHSRVRATKLVPAQSEIASSSKQMGVPVDGKFKKFDAQSRSTQEARSREIAFTIDLGSVSIGTAETEAELAKPDWFNTKSFPQATSSPAA